MDVSKRRYCVYDKKNKELPICIDGTAAECAALMGITLSSFYSTLSHIRNGKKKYRSDKWVILKSEEV